MSIEQYLRHKAICEYCGLRFASSQTKHKHIHRQHEQEIKRY